MLTFCKSILSEADGTGSFSRCASLIALIAVIVWVSRVIMFNHQIPDLTGPGTFVSIPYGLNLVKHGTAAVFGGDKS